MLNNIEYTVNIINKIQNNTICLEDIDINIIDKYSNCFKLMTTQYYCDFYEWNRFKLDIESLSLNEDNISNHIQELTSLFDTISYCMKKLNSIDYDAIISMYGLLCALNNILSSYEIVNKLTC